MEKGADHSTFVGGGFNRQENLHRILVSGNHRMSTFPHLPGRSLKVYLEAPVGFSIYSVHVFGSLLNDTLFCQGCILEVAGSAGTVGRMYILKTGRGKKPPPVTQVQLEGQLVSSL